MAILNNLAGTSFVITGIFWKLHTLMWHILLHFGDIISVLDLSFCQKN